VGEFMKTCIEMLAKLQNSFCPLVFPRSRILYLHAEGGALASIPACSRRRNREIPRGVGRLPNAVIYHVARGWIILVDIAKCNGPVDSHRRAELKTLFTSLNRPLVFVTAFRDQCEFARFQAVLSWGTSAWISTVPEHLIIFDGQQLMGPSLYERQRVRSSRMCISPLMRNP